MHKSKKDQLAYYFHLAANTGKSKEKIVPVSPSMAERFLLSHGLTCSPFNDDSPVSFFPECKPADIHRPVAFPQNPFALGDYYLLPEYQAIGDKGMEFPILATGINRYVQFAQIADEFLINPAAQPFLTPQAIFDTDD